VRHFTRSLANPQFNTEAMRRALPRAGIAYGTIQALGGRRGRSKEIYPKRNAGRKNATGVPTRLPAISLFCKSPSSNPASGARNETNHDVSHA
jgi:hypothetical protein